MDELKVSTEEEYLGLTTKKVKVSSGAVFHIKTMGPDSMIYALEVLPKAKLKDKTAIFKFMKMKGNELKKKLIEPNLIKPKIKAEYIAFIDSVDLFLEILSLSGILEEEGKEGAEDESFREPGSSPDS